jgi:hypothetical protein
MPIIDSRIRIIGIVRIIGIIRKIVIEKSIKNINHLRFTKEIKLIGLLK